MVRKGWKLVVVLVLSVLVVVLMVAEKSWTKVNMK